MTDVEADGGKVEKKLPYPIGVFFIVFNGFCDRFAYYGIKAILILYLSKVLLYSEDVSTQIYHLFFMFCTFTPLFGAIMADSFVGKFKTILIFTIVYIAGIVLLTAAATPPLQLPQREISILGLFLVAVGTGCVKPCVVALGGDTFTLPEQKEQLNSYFSIFYFAISAGSLLTTFILPILRNDVSCFGGDCYPLAFAVTASVMIAALVAFIVGKAFYKPENRNESEEGNVIIEICKCVGHALKVKWGLKREGKLTHFTRKSHWLDYAVGEYEKELIEDVKSVLKVLLLYLPLPMFWALMEQQGSRWTLQANRMDGNVFGYTLKPDHIQVTNPLLVLALIPAFDSFVYPVLGKLNILQKPLQRLAAGGLLASAAFLMSGFIELKLENSISTGGPTSLTLLNTMPCTLAYSLSNDKDGVQTLPMNQSFIFQSIDNFDNQKVKLHLNIATTIGPNDNILCNKTMNESMTYTSNKLQTHTTTTLEVHFDEMTNEISVHESVQSTNNNGEKPVHMLWLLPQYIALSLAEVLFAVTGLEFSYSQAPATMKSVMQSAWLLTIAAGNLVVAIVAKLKFFDDQSSEFFLFAALMLIDIIIFIWMANTYANKEVLSKSLTRRNSSQLYCEMRNNSLHNPTDKRPNFRKTIP